MTSALDRLVVGWLAWVVPATWQLALIVIAVAMVSWAARRASPRLRYTLWLLVLVKVFLPPSLAVGWGVGNWGLRPLWVKFPPEATQWWHIDAATAITGAAPRVIAAEPPSAAASLPPRVDDRANSTTILFAIWAVGCVALTGVVLWQYRRLKCAIARMELVDEGPLQIRLQKIAQQLGETQIPQLYLSDDTASPFLLGLVRPSVILPRQVVDDLNPAEVNSVLLHELTHWRHRDPWIGWVQVIAQSLFWFHPAVWWANARLRHERECVCDEAVLRTGECEPVSYGNALLAVLSVTRGRSPVQGSLVGVFEPGGNIQNRLEEIMSYERTKRKFGLLSYVAIAVFAITFLPMAISLQTASADLGPTAEESVKTRSLAWIVATCPAVGATDVDPALQEITVTFDRDMSMSPDMKRGMSWTGNDKFFMPPSAAAAEPHWRDSRTCVLPVKLAKGKYYRVGINSTSFQNFKSADGKSVPCSVLYFTTHGSSKAMQSRLRVPEVVKLVPANGADDVDPSVDALRVTFDLPMIEGMSWTGGGKDFPTVAKRRKPKWTNGGKTCVLPVELRAGHAYRLGLNSLSHINFQSKWGVPLEPVEYRFHTASEEK